VGCSLSDLLARERVPECLRCLFCNSILVRGSKLSGYIHLWSSGYCNRPLLPMKIEALGVTDHMETHRGTGKCELQA
jgi:hypothetical protein